MKLHCMVCSLQGTHMSKDSEIAIIDQKKLTLPLTSDMFTSPDPKHGVPAPWMRNDLGWKEMQCPKGRHSPWGIDYTDIPEAMENGGPSKLLTDKGMIDTIQMFKCDICGKEIKTKGAFSQHYKACARKNNEDR